jgi:hypothetical protein
MRLPAASGRGARTLREANSILATSPPDTRLHSRGVICPSFALAITLEERGRRECRVLQPPPTASRGVKEAHEQVTTGRAENTGIPCANGFNGFLRALPGEPGFFATVACAACRAQGRHRLCKLDTSVGMSGPHDFAVRAQRHSSFSTSPRPSHPASRFVTIAHTPLLPRRDGASFGFDLPDGTRKKFFARGLDHPNHVDKSREIGVFAQGIFRLKGSCGQLRLRQNAN